MGSGGTEEVLNMSMSMSLNRSASADPMGKAKAVLSDFRNAEDRNAEIEAKLNAARSRRAERGRKTAEVSVTPITLVSTSPPKERWKTSWSYSDPLEVSGSWSQHESMMKQAKQVEREAFLNELESSKRHASEKEKKDKEYEAALLAGSKQRREHEDFILQQVMNRRNLELNEMEARHRAIMDRSTKAMEAVTVEKTARQAHLAEQEIKRAARAQQRLEEQDNLYAKQLSEEHHKNEIKRAALEYKMEQSKAREDFLASRKAKEDKFKTKWAAMEEENERKRREFLQNKLDLVDKKSQDHAQMIGGVQQEIHGRINKRESEHSQRLSQEERKWSQKTSFWTSKHGEKSDRVDTLKRQKEEYHRQLMNKGKEQIKHKAVVEELYFSAQVCNKLTKPVIT